MVYQLPITTVIPQICFPTVLEIGVQNFFYWVKVKVLAGLVPPGVTEGMDNLFPYLFQLKVLHIH